MSQIYLQLGEGGFQVDSPVRNPGASEMARSSPPYTDRAGEEPWRGVLSAAQCYSKVAKFEPWSGSRGRPAFPFCCVEVSGAGGRGNGDASGRISRCRDDAGLCCYERPGLGVHIQLKAYSPLRVRRRPQVEAHAAQPSHQHRERPDQRVPRLHAALLRTCFQEPSRQRRLACRLPQRGPELPRSAEDAARFGLPTNTVC